MPPRKKPAAKIAKEELLEETITVSEPQMIPKRPLFRYINLNTLTKAQHIKVKLWKVYSCRMKHFSAELTSDSLYDFVYRRFETKNRKEEFFKTIKHKTIKRSFKYVKRFYYDPETLSSKQLAHALGCSSWKLDFLNIYFSTKPDYEIILKALLNSKLKDCVIHSNMVEDLDPKLVAAFRTLRKCNLLAEWCVNSLCMLLNPGKLIKYQKAQKLIQKKDESQGQGQFVSNRAIINAPECFEKISFDCWVSPERERNPIPHLPPLPNLQTLEFSWRFPPNEKKTVDISFVGQYAKLKYLAIWLDHCETETLEYLSDLVYLKELQLSFKRKDWKEGLVINLPNLTKLEKFGLEMSKPAIFTNADVKDFLLKNKDLKSLGLSLSMQHMSAIFEEGDPDFVLSSLERLRITVNSIETSYAGAAKIVAKALKRHHFVKKFFLNIEQSKADLNAVFFKDVIAHMKTLQSLTIGYKMSGGLEDNKFKHLKDVFNNLEGMTSLDLSLRHDTIGPREVSSILDGVLKMKDLKKLKLNFTLSKPTPGALNKISEFQSCVRKIPYLEVYFSGISKEDEKETEKTYLPRITLWKGTYTYPHARDYRI